MKASRVPLPAAAVGLAAVAGLFFVAPVLGLVFRAPWSHAVRELTRPEVLGALRLSLVCATLATALSLLLGVPLALVHARASFPGRGVLRAVTTLPIVLPPVVGGVALLLVFGRSSALGALLDRADLRLTFTAAGVVMAEAFVAMPFLVITVEGGLRAMDRRLEDAARTLGASPWTVLRRVTFPAIAPSLASGTVLCWARALGEFGATITFAGNFPGRTQTVPLAVYAALERSVDAAVLLSAILLVVCVVVLVLLRRRFLEAL